MSKKIITMSVCLILSLALANTLGSGVAWAHGAHGGSGGVGAHGGTTVGGDENVPGGHHVVHGGRSESGVVVLGGTNANGGSDVEGGSGAPDGKVKGGGKAHGKRDGKKGGPVALTGSTTCSVHGKIDFKPALVSGGTASSTVTVTGLLNRCSNGRPGKGKFNNGHLSALVGTISANDCTTLSSGAAPALSGGSVMWTPPSKVAVSSDVSMPASTGFIAASGAKSVIEIAYSGGSVGSGSFRNTDTSSLMVSSTQDTTQISGRCATGLTNVAFSGTVTL